MTLEEIVQENDRMKSALHLIAILSEKRDMHLGRPRSSDMSCIFCIAYLSENYGAYGEHITKEDLDAQIETLLKPKS